MRQRSGHSGLLEDLPSVLWLDCLEVLEDTEYRQSHRGEGELLSNADSGPTVEGQVFPTASEIVRAIVESTIQVDVHHLRHLQICPSLWSELLCVLSIYVFSTMH